MNTFSLASPPSHGGIYILKNETTGQFYVGQAINLKQRMAEWKACFATGLGFKSDRMRQAMTDSAEWTFIVFEEHPHADRAALLRIEQDRIIRFNAQAPDLILNTLIPTVRRTGLAGTKYRISYEGQEITAFVAADILGVNVKTIRNRMRMLSKKGIKNISIDELKKRSEIAKMTAGDRVLHCSRCGGVKENRHRGYCRACTIQYNQERYDRLTA